MTVTYLGNLTLGETIPAALSLSVAGQAGINLALPDIQARLSALLAFNPQPVSFEAQLALAQSILASVEATIALGLPVPDISAQIAIVLAQIAALETAIAAINTQLEIILSFQTALSTAGIHAYSFTGQTSDMGAEIAAETSGGLPGGGPSDPTTALLLAATEPTAVTSMQTILLL